MLDYCILFFPFLKAKHTLVCDLQPLTLSVEFDDNVMIFFVLSWPVEQTKRQGLLRSSCWIRYIDYVMHVHIIYMYMYMYVSMVTHDSTLNSNL